MKMFELLPRPLGKIFRKLTHLTCNSPTSNSTSAVTIPIEPAFKRVVIAPAFLRELNDLRAEIKVGDGKLLVEWKRNGAQIRVHVVVPSAVQAKLVLPGRSEVECPSGSSEWLTVLD